jgi:biotin carboxyl carrier protein
VPDDRDAARDDAARDDAARDDAARDDAARAADHAGIDRLVNALVPALIAKLGTLNVGELEVREGDWRIRLRRPAGAGPGFGRRVTDRPSRSHPGHEQHAHAAGAPEPHRAAEPHRPPRTAHPPPSAAADTNGSSGPALAPVGPGRAADGPSPVIKPDDPGHPQIATSPAVGVFQPGPKAVGGTRVRAGDRLGVVDMLGVPQEVVSPVDGIVVGVIVEAGTAVEYGQELIHLEPAVPAEGR